MGGLPDGLFNKERFLQQCDQAIYGIQFILFLAAAALRFDLHDAFTGDAVVGIVQQALLGPIWQTALLAVEP